MDPSFSPELIVAAYRGGFFPMPDPDTGDMLWYNPDPRTIIPLDQFHISKSLRKSARTRGYSITFDKDFRGVIEGCAAREPTWISEEIKVAYSKLFDVGIARSVEVWNQEGQLIGGLYGLTQNGVFNAESMFSRQVDASKMALWALKSRMLECGLELLEVQFMTEHLRSLGAIEIAKADYMIKLEAALKSTANLAYLEGSYNVL